MPIRDREHSSTLFLLFSSTFICHNVWPKLAPILSKNSKNNLEYSFINKFIGNENFLAFLFIFRMTGIEPYAYASSCV